MFVYVHVYVCYIKSVASRVTLSYLLCLAFSLTELLTTLPVPPH